MTASGIKPPVARPVPGLDPSEPPAQANGVVEAAMRALYDHYFACADYDRRYPRPNQRTMLFLLKHGGADARTVLDFGCGSGRYALALLATTQARVVGYDISSVALESFTQHAAQQGWTPRVRALGTQLHALRGAGPFDLALMLFGVLGHVGPRSDRLAALRTVAAQAQPGARLVLSVPNRWRRRPWDLLRAAWHRLMRHCGPAEGEPGNLWFTRRLGGQAHHFFYHLYTVAGLRQELAEGGWRLREVHAESLLPEWLITQHPWIGGLDAVCSAVCPASWGYGLLAVAERMDGAEAPSAGADASESGTDQVGD